MKKNLLFSLVCASTLAFAGCSGDDSSVSSGSASDSDTSSGSSGSSDSASASSTSTSTTSASGSASDSNSSSGGGACVPGQSVACTCPNGLMGAQVCAQDGMSFGACECAGTTTTSGDPTTSSTTAMDTTTTGVDPTTSTTGMDTTTTTGGTTGGMQDPYGPCPGGNDNECLDGEQCVTGMTGGMNGFMWSMCTSGTCMGNNQCDTIPNDLCADLPGDGMFQGYCVPQQCGNNMPPCPDNMQCAPGFNNNPGVCVWPS